MHAVDVYDSAKIIVDIGVMVASNWAVGTFMVISIGTWYVLSASFDIQLHDLRLCLARSICRKNMENERRRVQQVVEQIPKRFAKPENENGASNSSSQKTV